MRTRPLWAHWQSLKQEQNISCSQLPRVDSCKGSGFYFLGGGLECTLGPITCSESNTQGKMHTSKFLLGVLSITVNWGDFLHIPHYWKYTRNHPSLLIPVGFICFICCYVLSRLLTLTIICGINALTHSAMLVTGQQCGGYGSTTHATEDEWQSDTSGWCLYA